MVLFVLWDLLAAAFSGSADSLFDMRFAVPSAYCSKVWQDTHLASSYRILHGTV